MRKLLTILLLLLAVVAQGQMIIRANPQARAQGGAKTFDQIIADGNTIAYYEVGDGSATYMTLDDSVLTQWTDLSGNNRHITNASGDDRPAWDVVNSEIDFDGVNDYLSRSGLSINQPITAYLVLKINNYTAYSDILRINTGTNGKIRMLASSTTNGMALYGGGSTFSTSDSYFTDGTYYILRIVWNNDVSGGSKIQLNTGSAVTGTLATASMTVIQLPSEDTYADASYKALLLRTGVDSNTDQTTLVSGFNTKYSIY